MSTQSILALIARHPMLRTAQIADRLDVTVDQADTLLRPYLVAGTVVEHEVVAPNQLPAMAYEVSEQFKLTVDYRAIMSGEDIEVAPVVSAPPAKPVESATETGKTATKPAETASQAGKSASIAPKPVPTKPGSKVAAAIAYLTAHGSGTNDQLREVIGLRPGESVTNYLGRAVYDGRLARDGDLWVLGPGKAAPQAEEKPDAPPSYRFALWSDGQLEIQRDGAKVAALPRAEAANLLSFLQEAL